MKGVIQKDSTVLGTDGNIYRLPIRGMDDEGYDEVLIDARDVGGKGSFQRQSVKPFIGKTVDFVPRGDGYNYVIIPPYKKL